MKKRNLATEDSEKKQREDKRMHQETGSHYYILHPKIVKGKYEVLSEYAEGKETE